MIYISIILGLICMALFTSMGIEFYKKGLTLGIWLTFTFFVIEAIITSIAVFSLF